MTSTYATNTNFIVFGLTRSGLKQTNYHSQGELANHYTIDFEGYSRNVLCTLN